MSKQAGLLIAVVALSACGGGSSSGTVSVPVPTATPTICPAVAAPNGGGAGGAAGSAVGGAAAVGAAVAGGIAAGGGAYVVAGGVLVPYVAMLSPAPGASGVSRSIGTVTILAPLGFTGSVSLTSAVDTVAAGTPRLAGPANANGFYPYALLVGPLAGSTTYSEVVTFAPFSPGCTAPSYVAGTFTTAP